MQALGLKNLEPPDVAVSSMPSNWAGVIHHGMYELLVQHQSVPNRQTAVLIQKLIEYTESLGCSLSYLVYMTSLGKSLIQADPQIFDYFAHCKIVGGKFNFVYVYQEAN